MTSRAVVTHTPAGVTRLVSASAERVIDAPPATVYAILADYVNHHPRIMPAPPFSHLEVETGGVGEGTTFHISVGMSGRTDRLHMRVTEPEPGRVLTETNLESGEQTRFTVTPHSASGALVRISSDSRVEEGLRGSIDRVLKPRVISRLLDLQLGQLDRYVRSLKGAQS